MEANPFTGELFEIHQHLLKKDMDPVAFKQLVNDYNSTKLKSEPFYILDTDLFKKLYNKQYRLKHKADEAFKLREKKYNEQQKLDRKDPIKGPKLREKDMEYQMRYQLKQCQPIIEQELEKRMQNYKNHIDYLVRKHEEHGDVK